MKRTVDTSKPLWRKITHGTLMLTDHPTRIKPKEEVRLTQEQLGKWQDEFELLEDGTGKNKVSKKLTPKSIAEVEANAPTPDKETYKVVVAGTAGWYNIVSSDGKVMNDKKLRAEDAEALKEQLEEETVEE